MASTSPMRSIRDRSSTIAWVSAWAPPQTPEPAPLGMTAVPVWLGQARTSATSSVPVGEAPRAGFGQVAAAAPAEQRQRPGVDRALAAGLPVGADGAVGQAAGQDIQGAHQADSRPRPVTGLAACAGPDVNVGGRGLIPWAGVAIDATRAAAAEIVETYPPESAG